MPDVFPITYTETHTVRDASHRPWTQVLGTWTCGQMPPVAWATGLTEPTPQQHEARVRRMRQDAFDDVVRLAVQHRPGREA